MTRAEAGRLGGLATFRKYGREHMSRIGKLGFQAWVDKHWGGNREAATTWLYQRGLMAQDPAPWNGAWQFEEV